MALPRLSPPGGGGVALPRPLPAATASLIRAAFTSPTAPLDDLGDTPLLGHILADRYLSIAGRPTVDDLRHWLARYANLPDAPAIHALLLARLPRGAPVPAPPPLAAFNPAPVGDELETGSRLLPRNAMLDHAIHDAARAGQFDRALRLIARTRGLPSGYAALLRAEVAQAMFSQGDDKQALKLAEAAFEQSRGTIGMAPWIGGLAAWRLGRLELARTLFEQAYRAPVIAPGQRTGAAFWAARASLVTRGDHGPWMQRAARDPRTFYGLLARRVLGQPLLPPGAPQETLGEADIEAVAATDRGERAFALLQVGQPNRAAAELRQLWTETREQPGFGRSILAIARAAKLHDLVGQLDAITQPAALRFPATKLQPTGGFKVDPALIYALTRLESNFDATAVSPAGARGLMQLMPLTVRLVSGGSHGASLHDPATNLDMGQRFLLQLGQLDIVGTDLIRLLATYNAGNGSLAKWLQVMPHEDDPLLFLASIPGEECRSYVPRALSYMWLYAAQLGLPSPSLDDLAAGRWPRFVAWHGRVAARLH